jgi:hypothetical protein
MLYYLPHLPAASTPPSTPLAALAESTELTKDQFKELLKKIDSGLRALPATAQVREFQNIPCRGGTCEGVETWLSGSEHSLPLHR